MANEKRLIDANAVRDALYDADAITMKGVALINQFPTVEAVEVVHGRWEEIGVADYKCSRCGFRFTSADPISMFEYCRFGAKMDGGNEDG